MHRAADSGLGVSKLRCCSQRSQNPEPAQSGLFPGVFQVPEIEVSVRDTWGPHRRALGEGELEAISKSSFQAPAGQGQSGESLPPAPVSGQPNALTPQDWLKQPWLETSQDAKKK